MTAIGTQINNLIDVTLSANREVTDREQIEQAGDRSYAMWHNIGLLLHSNFITTHLTLINSICACSYVPTAPTPTSLTPDQMKTTLQTEMRDVRIEEGNKYLGAQKLIMYIYDNYISVITQFTGVDTSNTPVSIDITLYHNRIRNSLKQMVVNFINSIPHDYFNTGNDLFEKVKDFNKNLAKLLYDSNLHFILPNDGICTIAGASGPLPYIGAVYS
jgi:hypothetical protein